ncbi:MAG: terpene cyclase/mutase family protein [Gammaproteobacteria bacterium]|jgi:prenyltransferase beta subunit
MRGRWLWTALAALSLLPGIIRSASSQDIKTEVAIDLQKTVALVKQWGTRPSFPESVTFAYYHVYMLRALGQEITPEIRKSISGYIAGCQQPDGGFTPAPVHAKTANVIYSYYALKTLDLLGETKVIDSKAVTGFLLARIQEDGGLVATAKEGERANLATTYYGIEALRLLGAVTSLDKTKTIDFIQRYREQGQGFTRVEGGVSTPQSTFMGVRALKSLGALTKQDRSEVVTYLKGTRYSGLNKDRQYKLLPNIEAMAATLEALAVLSAVQEIDSEKVYEFISSLYVPDNGGFGPRPGLGTTPPGTYYAILSLVHLGKLPDPLIRKRVPGSTAAPLVVESRCCLPINIWFGLSVRKNRADNVIPGHSTQTGYPSLASSNIP